MSIRIRRRWALAISCLIISGCTEKTIIREVPSSEPEAGVQDTVLPGSGDLLAPTAGTSNMVTGVDAADTSQLEELQIEGGSNMVVAGLENAIDSDIDTEAATESDTDSDQLEDPMANGEPVENLEEPLQEQDPISESVNGEPGLTADCMDTLPCRWSSADAQFSVTVTNADNFAVRDWLQLNYSLSAIHDTQVSVTGGGQALDDAGLQFQPSEQRLGTGVSGNAQTLLAGSTLNGVVIFDQGSQSTSLTEWSVTILDGGVARMPSFANIPVGTITSAYADCELVLPCVWLTPQGNVSVTLTAAGGYTVNNRLSTNFTVESATSIDVALDSGASAVGSGGTDFTGRTHGLGAYTGSGKVTSQANSGYVLSGVVNFNRNSSEPVALDELSLILYQDSPVPRWNPKFINVPVQ